MGGPPKQPEGGVAVREERCEYMKICGFQSGEPRHGADSGGLVVNGRKPGVGRLRKIYLLTTVDFIRYHSLRERESEASLAGLKNMSSGRLMAGTNGRRRDGGYKTNISGYKT